MNNDPSLKLELFVEEWAQSLCRDDEISLDLFLANNLESYLILIQQDQQSMQLS